MASASEGEGGAAPLEASSSSEAQREPGSQTATFYTETPPNEASLEEFEQVGGGRLQLLKQCSHLSSGARSNKLAKMLGSFVSDRHNGTNGRSASNRDVLSHYVLRLVFCWSEELRVAFVERESALLKFRLEGLTCEQLKHFMEQEELTYDEVSQADVRSRRSHLVAVGNTPPLQTLEHGTFYRIPFTEACSLVRRRLVFVEGGFAYVPIQQMTSVIVARFGVFLAKQLQIASNAYCLIAQEERLAPILQRLRDEWLRYVSENLPTSGIEPLHVNQLDALAERGSMPPCMFHLHTSLKQTHHLKYKGRLQYLPYLREAGLGVEEALVFWRRELLKGPMDADEYRRKQYDYTLRYMYGLEGQQKKYYTHSCRQIINAAPPAAGQHHGCPFRDFDTAHLEDLLRRMGVASPEDRAGIIKLANDKKYQNACKLTYRCLHNGSEVHHNKPNDWTAASRAHWADGDDPAAAT